MENYESEYFNDPVQVEEPTQATSQQASFEQPPFQIDPNEYNNLKSTVQQLAPVIQNIRQAVGVQQPAAPVDPVEAFINQAVERGVQQHLQQKGYVTQESLQAESVVKDLGFRSPTAASNYYAIHLENALEESPIGSQERATAESILNLYQSGKVTQALKLAGQVYGKAPQFGSQQQTGQTQTFGHQPGVRQQQTQKPFASEAEFNEAFYNEKHAKYKQAQQWNAKMARAGFTGEEIESPY